VAAVAHVEARDVDGTVVIMLFGDADLEIAPALRDELEVALANRLGDVVLDLSKATLIDSMALGVVLRAAKRLRAQSRRLHVVVPQAALRRIFEITLLDRAVVLHASTDAALHAAGVFQLDASEGRGEA
jgi:anti-sigma B factor antagonist